LLADRRVSPQLEDFFKFACGCRSISALYGLSHEVITQKQDSLLVAAVVASPVLPTVIANHFFFPKNLLDPARAALIPAKQFNEEQEEHLNQKTFCPHNCQPGWLASSQRLNP